MQHLKLLFSFVIFCNFTYAEYFKVYIDSVTELCKFSNVLIVKKSLIFMVNDGEKKCDDNFSKALLSKCSGEVTCIDLYSILEKSKSFSTGNIVGN